MNKIKLGSMLIGLMISNSASATNYAAKSAQMASGTARVTPADSDVPLSVKDEARQVAENYLRAISRQGSDGGLDSLLGGATLTARIFNIENWKIVRREKHRHEEGDLATLRARIDALDKAGRESFSAMLKGSSRGADADGLAMQEISIAQAARILKPTQAKAQELIKYHQVFAYVARVNKEVYWHPKNPIRKLLAEAGRKGRYLVDVDYFVIETMEQTIDGQQARPWPLRVVRFQTRGRDTGFKILPASDWSAE